MPVFYTSFRNLKTAMSVEGMFILCILYIHITTFVTRLDGFLIFAIIFATFAIKINHQRPLMPFVNYASSRLLFQGLLLRLWPHFYFKHII